MQNCEIEVSLTGRFARMFRPICLAASTLAGVLVGLTGTAVAGAQSGCADLGGNIQAGNVCRAYLETPAYIVELRFRTDYVDGQAVTDYLAQERDRLVNASQMPSARELPYKLYVTYRYYSSGRRLNTTQAEQGYGKPPLGTQSLVFNDSLTVNGDPLPTKIKSFTFNLNQNRPVTFGDLFAPGTNPIDPIYRAVAADLERQQHPRDFKLTADVGRNPATYQNFAITDDALIFFFPEGELLTKDSGNLVATVPRAMLPPLQL
jgi:Protein of unknown function (DUF3298)